jgi:hypothetical protein
MNFFKKKSIKVWAGVNKNGKLSLHGEQPVRDDDRGIWVSKLPFVNSVLYDQVATMFEKANITWTNDCEFLEFQLAQ